MALNEEQLKDIAERRAGFMKEIDALRLKWGCRIGCMPEYVPKPDGTWGTVVLIDAVDTKYQAKGESILHAPKAP